MDQKQFERLQAAVQTVVDEARARMEMPDLSTKRNSWTWDQNSWGWGTITDEVAREEGSYTWHAVCGSGGCLAGTIVYQNGDRFLHPVDKDADVGPGSLVSVEMCLDEDGNVHGIADRAEELIGLDQQESSALFSGRNRSSTIVELATSYAQAHGFELEVV